MPDVTNIQQNSRVLVNDVIVGHITKIERQGWHALLTMRINGDVNYDTFSVSNTVQLNGTMRVQLNYTPTAQGISYQLLLYGNRPNPLTNQFALIDCGGLGYLYSGNSLDFVWPG